VVKVASPFPHCDAGGYSRRIYRKLFPEFPKDVTRSTCRGKKDLTTKAGMQ
jgi:hypothetical protein